MITTDTPQIAIADIHVARDTRQRRSIVTEDLQASIRRVGLIHPVVITRDGELKAGERRLTACRALGWTHIPVTYLEDLGPIEGRLVELEENVKRHALSWQDQVRSVREIHELYCELEPDWTHAQTAAAISVHESIISKYLAVASGLVDDRVADSKTINEALNILQRREQRQQGQELQALLDMTEDDVGVDTDVGTSGGLSLNGSSVVIARPAVAPRPVPIEEIRQGSFLEWAPTYTGPKFNFIHCDFPYGIDVFSGPQARGSEPSAGYRDGAEVYWQLLDCLVTNLDRIMSISSHLMFWFSDRPDIGQRTREVFRTRAPSLAFSTFPLIWIKSDNAGIAGDHRRQPRHIYETALLASRGGRNIVEIRADAYSAPTDKSLHPSTKPEPMLRHFFSMLVDRESVVLDPTCGSGSAIRAADSLGAKHLLGLELDHDYARVAKQALVNSRLKRSANGLGL